MSGWRVEFPGIGSVAFWPEGRLGVELLKAVRSYVSSATCSARYVPVKVCCAPRFSNKLGNSPIELL
eukprot:4656832-Amphidinium_carterae.1